MIQSVKGTKDLLPESIYQWQFIEDVFRKVSSQFGYEELRTPIFEKTEVFCRSIGEATDIVNKEMYTFIDKGGESITLRPEMTAALVRSLIQSGLYTQQSQLRLWYTGPFFRYERPQKGRLRQFHQYGAECIGSPFPEADAEVISLAANLFKVAGITNYTLNLNTLGNDSSRAVYRNSLVEFLNKHRADLSKDSQTRLDANPLRVLDSKDPQDAAIITDAPMLADFLDSESVQHFDSVKKYLEEFGIDYVISPRLVRGLDYYCHTVFEFTSNALGAQDAFGGGGRYNSLFEQLGAKPTPAVGFALGVERMLLILEQLKSIPENANYPEIFVIAANNDFLTYSLKVASILRNAGNRVAVDLLRRSMKAQMREANRLNVKYTVIIGENEYQNNTVLIKNMQNSEQIEIKVDEIINYTF